MAYLLPQIPKEKLLTALERVLVDVTNKVGVDINRAVTDSYYQHLLPFVCGLGPRKAQVLVKKIAAIVSGTSHISLAYHTYGACAGRHAHEPRPIHPK